jgi:PKD repeat protein
MKKKLCTTALCWLGFVSVHVVFAQADKSPASPETKLLSGCMPATAQADLDINNIRATILNGGDLWHHLANQQPGYEVPKGGLWFSCLDAGSQMHVAAHLYRQNGPDFWPGPIDPATNDVSSDSCLWYDKVYKIDRAEVLYFTQHRNDDGYVIPASILNWPGKIAPYKDVNADNLYNPLDGDYPGYSLDAAQQNCQTDLLGDQSLWWVFNDVGNSHSTTGGTSIGLEVQAQAFAYKTDDEINDMTFYRYTFINRSINSYSDCYLGFFIDAGIGSNHDDYLGCDVGRSLGFFYNSDATDNYSYWELSYRDHPPALGFDVFDGPLADPGDGIDNDRDSIIDETGECISMSNYLHYFGTDQIDGHSDVDIFNFMRSRLAIGYPLEYGSDGVYTGGVECKFHFPGGSDPNGWGTGGVPQPYWDEASAGIMPGQRASIQSYGAFSFLPGQIKTITSGMIWARDTEGDHLASLAKMKLADDKAQALFNNCFQISCVPPQAVILQSQNGLTVNFSYPNAGDNFTWTFGDCEYNTSSERNPSHTYCRPGTYEACLTVSNECGTDQICVSVTVEHKKPGVKLKRIEGRGNGGNYLSFAAGMHDSLMSSPYRIFHPVYDYSQGPAEIEVIDRTAVPADIFTIELDSVFDSASWKMYRLNSADTVFANQSIAIGEWQLIPQWGLSVRMKQVKNPGYFDYEVGHKSAFIATSKIYSDNSKQWLGAIEDNDTISHNNWIRSGQDRYPNPYSSYDDNNDDMFSYYDNVLNGTFAPYKITGSSNHFTTGYKGGPRFNFASSLNLLDDVASIDLVITADQSKWSRCPVIEMSEQYLLSEGGAFKHSLRKSPSVGKNGSPDGTGNGMGWFPGYAVNVETGERLNLMFGEDSWLVSQNGRDMKWNPTSLEYSGSEPIFGGKHYIYIMGHNSDNHYGGDPYIGNGRKDVNLYDEGQSMKALFNASENAPSPNAYLAQIYKDAMWVNIPLLNPGHQLLSSDVTIRLRVNRTYAKYKTYSPEVNNQNPMYQFDGRDINNPGGTIPEFVNDYSTVYPNPFATFSTIRWNNEKCVEHRLELFDVTGKLLRMYDNIKSDRIIIDRNGLAPGIYIYSLIKEGEVVSKGKIVVK